MLSEKTVTTFTCTEYIEKFSDEEQEVLFKPLMTWDVRELISKG